MNNGRVFTLIGGIFALIGLILLGVTVALVTSTSSFLASAERTEGIVVELTEQTTAKKRSSGGYRRRSTTWHPIVEFTVDGKLYSFQDSTGSNPPAHTEGETVPVAYDPDDPSEAQISSFWSAYLGPVITGGLGVLFTPIGTMLLVRGRRIARRARPS